MEDDGQFERLPQQFEEILLGDGPGAKICHLDSTTLTSVFGNNDQSSSDGMLGGMLKTLSATQPSSGYKSSNDPSVKYSAESQDIVSGAIGGFMKNSPVDLSEKACIQDNMGAVTGGIVNVGYDLQDVATNLMGFNEKGPNGDKHENLDKGSLMSDGLGGAMAITQMVTSIRALATTCFKADGLALMKTAGQHISDLNWLKTRFATQGVNIARTAADGIIKYGEKDYHGFGHDIGKIGRKITLSTAVGDAPLPPMSAAESQLITEQVMEGVTNGLFMAGSTLDITDNLDSKVHISVDLNRCMYGNRHEWENIFEGTWGVIAKFAAGGKNMLAPNAAGVPMGADNAWQSDLMMAMVGLPMAAQKCGLGFDVINDLKRATKSMNGLKFKFRFPNSQTNSVNEVNEKMAKAIKDWTNQDYRKFGDHLGHFTRDMVFMAGKGMFQGKFDISHEFFEPGEWDDANQAPQAFSVVTMYGGIAMVFLLVLVAVRVVRPSVARAGSSDEENQQHLVCEELQEDAEGSAVE